jgi:hypothetical protein
VVLGTASGFIHAMDGSTGEDIDSFPFRAGGRLHAPVLITKLNDGSPGQHVVTMAFDGFMYMGKRAQWGWLCAYVWHGSWCRFAAWKGAGQLAWQLQNPAGACA